MFRDFVRIASCVPATKSGMPLENSRTVADLIDVITSAEENVDFILFPFNILCGANMNSLLYNDSFADLCEQAEALLIDFIKEKNIESTVIFSVETVCRRCRKNGVKIFVANKNAVNIRKLCGCEADGGNAVYETSDFKFCVLPVTNTEQDLAFHYNEILSSEFVFLTCAIPEQIARFEKTLDLVKSMSKIAGNAILLANTAATNTTTPYFYIGRTAAVHNGTLLDTARQNDFSEIIALNDIDFKTVKLKNRRIGLCCEDKSKFFELVRDDNDIGGKYRDNYEKKLYCSFSKEPFFEQDLTEEQINQRLDDIINFEKFVIAGRIRALTENNSNCEKVVVAVSGGLDSTAALIYAYEAIKLLGLPPESIIAVTMKGFGTSKKTRINAFDLIEAVGAKLIDVPIEKSVRQHFADIGHDEKIKNVVYENAQARERMQIPLDLANKYGGFVLNTGDLSEGALGFCTFGGDHFGQLAVNSCITKTMLRRIIRRYANITENRDLADILIKIADTKISPELLPPDENGDISQSTEEFVGPYILHDFFLYYYLRYNFSAEKIYFYAVRAFWDIFSPADVKKYLQIFLKRFYANQFKRTCSPEGAIISSVNLSPLDFIFPSDLNSAELIDLPDEI